MRNSELSAEHDQPIDHLLVQQIAHRQMPAEHVLAEDAAVAAEAHPFRIEDDLRVAGEVAHHVAAPGADLLEEEASIDVRSGDRGEVLDRPADEPLMDDGADHGP